ncbi:MAG: glycosyltransferase, partial [Chloroflexota bacterium]
PNLITPFMLDQFFWADLIVKAGIGLRMADAKRLTAEKLAHAIDTAVTDKAMQDRARAFGEKIRQENGTARAAEVIERYAAQAQSNRLL